MSLGTNYDFQLKIGFKIPYDLVHDKLVTVVHTPGKFHYEDRYCPKTGKQIQSEKVWDECPSDDETVIIDGIKYTDGNYDVTEIICDELSKLLDAYVEATTDDSNDTFSYNIDVLKSKINKSNLIDYGRTTLYRVNLPYKEAMSVAQKLETIKEKLKELGIEAGEPIIYISTNVG